MSQVNAGDFPIDPQVTSGTALAEILNRWFNASNTQNSGATQPPTTYPGMFWYDSSVTPPVLKIRNAGNTGWTDFADTLVLDTTNIAGLGTMARVNSPVPIANGGTGATDAAGARWALGLDLLLNAKQVIAWNNSTVYIGWDTGLQLQVDSTWFGNVWPISISGGATSINGISGWRYADPGVNPVYVWSSNGATTDQFLSNAANLRVSYAASTNYATNAGTAGYCSGTAENANNLQGIPPGGFIQADNCNVAGYFSGSYADPFMRHTPSGSYRRLCYQTNDDQTTKSFRLAAGNLIMEISGVNGAWACQITPSDIRLKDNVVPSEVNATEAVKQFEFIAFDWKKQDTAQLQLGTGTHTALGFSAQNLQSINDQLVVATAQPEGSPLEELGEVLSPNTVSLLAYISKALQETIARVDALEQA